jgi:hypothetical protein
MRGPLPEEGRIDDSTRQIVDESEKIAPLAIPLDGYQAVGGIHSCEKESAVNWTADSLVFL